MFPGMAAFRILRTLSARFPREPAVTCDMMPEGGCLEAACGLYCNTATTRLRLSPCLDLYSMLIDKNKNLHDARDKFVRQHFSPRALLACWKLCLPLLDTTPFQQYTHIQPITMISGSISVGGSATARAQRCPRRVVAKVRSTCCKFCGVLPVARAQRTRLSATSMRTRAERCRYAHLSVVPGRHPTAAYLDWMLCAAVQMRALYRALLPRRN